MLCWAEGTLRWLSYCVNVCKLYLLFLLFMFWFSICCNQPWTLGTGWSWIKIPVNTVLLIEFLCHWFYHYSDRRKGLISKDHCSHVINILILLLLLFYLAFPPRSLGHYICLSLRTGSWKSLAGKRVTNTWWPGRFWQLRLVRYTFHCSILCCTASLNTGSIC